MWRLLAHGLQVIMLPSGAVRQKQAAALPLRAGDLAASYFSCPYLSHQVELTEERERHIAENHPDLLPEHRGRVADTLADPDQVRRSGGVGNALLFSRWFETVRGGKYVVVVVLAGGAPGGRNWVVTAYLARRLAEGEVEWRRG